MSGLLRKPLFFCLIDWIVEQRGRKRDGDAERLADSAGSGICGSGECGRGQREPRAWGLASL